MYRRKRSIVPYSSKKPHPLHSVRPSRNAQYIPFSFPLGDLERYLRLICFQSTFPPNDNVFIAEWGENHYLGLHPRHLPFLFVPHNWPFEQFPSRPRFSLYLPTDTLHSVPCASIILTPLPRPLPFSFPQRTMVIKTELCAFSDYRIYPGNGMLFIRRDGRPVTLGSSKARALMQQRKKPSKLVWTQSWRRQHKKGLSETILKKRTRRVNKIQRAVVGASIEEITKRSTQNKAFRDAQQKAAKKEIKDRKVKAAAGGKKQSFNKSAQFQKAAHKKHKMSIKSTQR